MELVSCGHLFIDAYCLTVPFKSNELIAFSFPLFHVLCFFCQMWSLLLCVAGMMLQFWRIVGGRKRVVLHINLIAFKISIMNMSGGEGRKLSNQDIQLVQNRIEQCLQHYMNKKEVINALIIQDNIEPRFTELVWQRLEEENQEFFKAYYLKLLVKDQIMEFNRLLSEQVELMRRIGLSGMASVLTSNGSHVSPTQHISTSGAAQNARPLKTEGMLQANVFHNCGSSIQPCVQGTLDGSIHSRKIDVTPSLFLSQNSNIGLAQTMNGKIVKTEAGYAGSSAFDFSPPSNYLESRPLMGDASVSSFSSVDSNAQHLNETLLDGDASSFGFLAQIPQNFSLPELPADFTSSSDLLESYCRPPFLAPDTNNLVDPHGDVERLDPESESLRFQCFGGD